MNDTFYPVFVSGTGVQTPFIKNEATAFSFNPSTGTVTSTTFSAVSDERLKSDIKTLEYCIEILNQIRPVSFNLKTTNHKSYGVIAQEIEEILPEIVNTDDRDGYKSVNYIPLIALLIEVVKKQHVEIEKIKNKLDIEE